MFCIYCGTDNPNNAIFCRGCGKRQPTNDGTIVAAPGIFVESGQSTTGNVPMIQGTPQAGGVPTVQGTPSKPDSVGSGQGMLNNVEKPGNRTKIWGIGLREIVAMLIGTVLYIVFRSFIVFWGFHGIIYTNMLFIIPALVIPLFIGATFGPWVGLVTGGIGTAISSYITPWDFISLSPATRVMSRQLLLLDQPLFLIVLGPALIGFIAGLVLYGTRGHYNTFRSIVIADIVGAIGIILGLGLAQALFSSSPLSTAFTNLILPNVVFSLVLLPILLSTYNIVSEHLTSS